jgi:hypothetical protein
MQFFQRVPFMTSALTVDFDYKQDLSMITMNHTSMIE